MEMTLIFAILAGLGLGALVAALVLAGNRPGKGDELRALDELSGRLGQMADSQAAQQSRLSEQLQIQERFLARALDERIGAFSKKVGDRLQEANSSNQSLLSDLRERLAVIDKAQTNITELSSQVVGLQDILANKQARGAFGEIQLRDIIEAVLPPSACAFQVTLGNGKRADCLLTLPYPPGPIAIDSKFPLESYQALRDAKDDVALVKAQRTFAADIKKHVQDIAERYILPGETADSALMFLPSEAVYAELHANFRGVVEDSFRARVWIVSPTTLMATLNTIRSVLKDVYMREQAGVIRAEIDHMIGDLGRLDKRVGNLETHFNQARNDIEEIRTSTSKIKRRGERINDLDLEEREAVTEPIQATAAAQVKVS